MNFLKDIFLGAIKGILSLGIALIMLLIFFSIIGALFSPDTEEEVVVSDNSLLYIDNLSLIGDRDTKADELNFDFEIPLPLPIIDNSQTEKISLLTVKNIINNVLNKNKPEKNQIWSGVPGDLNFNINAGQRYFIDKKILHIYKAPSI